LAQRRKEVIKVKLNKEVGKVEKELSKRKEKLGSI